MLKRVTAGVLEVAYEEAGPADGAPVVLLHGFPYDVTAFAETTPLLVARGCRVIAPYLRGYGPTRFVSPATPRSGQQAVLGHDLLELLNALAIPRAVLAGYDWGGRAACLAAILAPERVRALVAIGGYNVQNTLAPSRPAPAAQERAFWYQWYFNTERGRLGFAQNRREICRMLWRDWSPSYQFDEATFERTAVAFDNPDFVDVVIHSYRHRHGNAPGEARFDAMERRLATQPPITVPTVILHGGDDGVSLSRATERELSMFPAGTARHVVAGAGHFLPREKPGAPAVVDALLTLLR